MPPIRLAAAQCHSIRGDIAANIEIHCEFARAAAEQGVDYLLFPELSLTGYEPELAQALAVQEPLTPLDQLREMARSTGMYIAVGAPLAAHPQPQIGLILFRPDGRIYRYAKQHLHPGEERHFCSGTDPLHLDLKGLRLSHAICADGSHPEHAAQSVGLGGEVYLVSALISGTGYPPDSARLAAIARDHQQLVLLANHHRPTGGWHPCGRSAAWSSGGLLAQAPAEGAALVIAEYQDGGWRGQSLLL